MVRNFLIRLVINAVALYVTASILPGIHINGEVGTLLLVALVLGIVNAVVKPVLKVLTCPFFILTLGLFILVINGLMLLLTSAIINDPTKFYIDGFWPAVFGGIVMGIVAIVVEFVLDRVGLNED